jgi:hypothetical protein
MNPLLHKKWVSFSTGLCLSIILLSGCSTNLNPLTPPPPPTPPTRQIIDTNDYTVTFTYTASGSVKLSANNVLLRIGQKLILQGAPNLAANTRFSSSAPDFVGDFLKQDTSQQTSGKVVFTAIKRGKGKLQVIPNTNDVARAADLWVTVQ